MADEGNTKIAFMPEMLGSASIQNMIERARVLAGGSSGEFPNASLALEQSLEHRARIINRYGQTHFDADLENMDEATELGDFLFRYETKEG